MTTPYTESYSQLLAVSSSAMSNKQGHSIFDRRSFLKTAIGTGAVVGVLKAAAQPAAATPVADRVPDAFEQGLTVEIDGEDWYFNGPPLEDPEEADGAPEQDVPGHWWNVTARGPDGAERVRGKHYNLFPHPVIADLDIDVPPPLDIDDRDAAAGGWASEVGTAGDDTDDFEGAADPVEEAELLYHADGIIEEYDADRADELAKKGYVHYHEFTHVETGEHHPTKVVWLKHTARSSFWFDGGPPFASDFYDDEEDYPYRVDPGVDFDFLPNWNDEYDPDGPFDL